MVFIDKIAGEAGVSSDKVKAVIALLDQEATVPFIARYRKEATGSMDENRIILVRDRYAYYRALEKRKEFVLKKIAEKNQLSPELEKSIKESGSAEEVEELYLPYKTARKTKAAEAVEKGLKEIAENIFKGVVADPEKEAAKYLDPEKELFSVNDVLEGCRNIAAAKINEEPVVRKKVLELFRREAFIESKAVEKNKEKGIKYRDYFNYREKAFDAPPHRIHAVLRGKKEKIISLSIKPELSKILDLVRDLVTGSRGNSRQGSARFSSKAETFMLQAAEESVKRLLLPSVENMITAELKEKADFFAADMFAENLKQLLLSAPFGRKPVIAVDPGIRTGSKAVCLDRSGNLLGYTLISAFKTAQNGAGKGIEVIREFIETHRAEAVVIGNGTGSGEIREYLTAGLDGCAIPVVTINESGASVYSASKSAGKEFPDLDITFRSAVSIGRRFQDPLSELVKIDPVSIGVGQYQHDVDKKKLDTALRDVVVSCVNSKGVEVNTAGLELLSYVSGLNPLTAEKIVSARNKAGSFNSREDLLKVKGLGRKIYEQAAGFLKIQDSINPLDNTFIHPDHYKAAERILSEFSLDLSEPQGFSGLSDLVNPEKYIDNTVGVLTASDIIRELEKLSSNAEEEFIPFSYTEGIKSIEDLKPGMKVKGIITNVTAFGAFADIGVHQDGFIHISKISKNYVKKTSDYVRVNQIINVTVISIDRDRNRISLSLLTD